jgi:hypothetical protein
MLPSTLSAVSHTLVSFLCSLANRHYRKSTMDSHYLAVRQHPLILCSSTQEENTTPCKLTATFGSLNTGIAIL